MSENGQQYLRILYFIRINEYYQYRLIPFNGIVLRAGGESIPARIKIQVVLCPVCLVSCVHSEK